MNNEKIVNSIKNLCKEYNITVTKLEETLGMSQGLIGRWNKSDPSLSKIIDIADYFKISLDEVVGYNNFVNDKFIEKLLLQTSDKILIWYNYNNGESIPKQYKNNEIYKIEFIDQNDANEYFSTHVELSYYTRIKNGYISIYSFYEYGDIKKPTDLKLFIQPNDNAELIYQDYSKEQLIYLWLKILYNLKESAPDEIKAEELKNSFVLEDNKKEDTNTTIKNDINTIVNNPNLIKFLDIVNTPEFQKIQQTFSNPEFQKAVQAANKVQQNLNVNLWYSKK